MQPSPPSGLGDSASPGGRIPLSVKLLYTAFMAVLVPCYWSAYGPTNFLYFCDVALFMTLAALWTENALLASTPLVGILLPQMLWCADVFGTLAGRPITGMTAYMFDANLPLFTRGLSSFHGWLPFLLLWVVWRLGYDRRAFWVWTALALTLMVVCFFLLPPPPAPPETPNIPVNVNYVYGFSDDRPQQWMDPRLFFLLMLVAQPLVIILPAHLLLRTFFPAPRDARIGEAA